MELFSDISKASFYWFKLLELTPSSFSNKRKMISSSDCHLSVGYRDKLSETRVPSRVQRKGPYLRMRNMLNTAQIELHVKARGNPTYRSAYKKRTLEPLDSTWLQHAPSLHTITWCNSGIGSKHNAGNTPASLVIYNYRLWIPSKRTSIVPMGNWYTAEWPLREIIGKNCPLLYLYCKMVTYCTFYSTLRLTATTFFVQTLSTMQR